MKPATFIAPGASLGVLGGGQLGRMFVHAAQQMGYRTVVLEPDPSSPAGAAAHQHLRYAYLDQEGLRTLAEQTDAITTEFENVPAQALLQLAQSRPVSPAAAAVSTCQDRAAEKAHLRACGVACAPHALLQTAAELSTIDPALFPAIVKTTRMGYDGKGQQRVDTLAQLPAAWQALGQVPCIVEQGLALACELSVIVARSAAGQVVHFPVQHNLHRDGVLAITQVPAPDVPTALQVQAIQDAEKMAVHLDYVGVLCVEFFVLSDGRLVVNEMAPRPHNSGHYSLDACDVSQFELQVRCLTHSPLPMPRLHSCAVMLNLLGDLWWTHGDTKPQPPPWEQLLGLPGVHLHLYGKDQPRPGRKMGHLTVTANHADAARRTALQAAALLGVAPW
jgi:5-(carboxyamino)imidazole ribonucleotide synthase